MSSFQETIDKLQEKAKVLTGERKKRGKSVPEGLASLDDIRNFTTLASHPGLHSASVPGILSIDINANNTSKILTGGADKTATVFNKDDQQVGVPYIYCWNALQCVNETRGSNSADFRLHRMSRGSFSFVHL
jgi:hypothetical protein